MAAEAATTPIDAAEADRLLAGLEAASGLAVAVSGGADSVALMRLVADWRSRERSGLPVVALTVDHGLRTESAGEARRVKRWAKAVGLDHETLAWTGEKPGSDIQAGAREARYSLLAQACVRRGLSHLVTAHHLDDQAETLLLRLARGSGVDGLSAMPSTSDWLGVRLARPLLDIHKGRFVATLERLGQDWIEDPSNTDRRYARARIRALMPELAAEGMTARRLADTARRMRRARAALESAAADLHLSAVSEDAAGFCLIDRRVLCAAPEEIALRVLARLLMGIGGSDYPPRVERLERLHARLAGDAGDAGSGGRSVVTLSGCRLVVDGGNILIHRESGRTGLPVEPLPGSGALVWDRRFRIDAAGRRTGGRLLVRALGADGVAAVRRQSRLRDIPAAIARVAPGVFSGDRLVAAPSVEAEPGPFSPGHLSVDFVGRSRFASAARAGTGAPA